MDDATRIRIAAALNAAADRLDPEHVPCVIGGSLIEAEQFGSKDFGGEGEDAGDRNAMLYGPDPFMLIPKGEVIQVHLNLGVKLKKYKLKTWSAKWKKKKAHVYGHPTSVTLVNAIFQASARGNRLVQEQGEKTVHAWVEGKLAKSSPPDSEMRSPPGGALQVRYNPKEMHTFMREAEDGSWTIPVAGAKKVYMLSTWGVFAEGIEDAE